MSREAKVWNVRAADLRRMAGRAQEVERERKLLALADQYEESDRKISVRMTDRDEDRRDE
jgi:hypothetical protein